MSTSDILPPAQLTIQDLRSLGGKARAKNLSPERRKEIAIKASSSRKCASNRPKATHVGDLSIGNIPVECAVLQDGTRVITESAMFKLMGSARGGRVGPAELPRFLTNLNIKPFITNDLRGGAAIIEFVHPKAGKAYGYKADLIPQICKIFLDARRDGIKLTETQKNIAMQAEIIVQALASVGINALIDEATGYQYDREHDALQKLLKAYITKELQPWTKRFPLEFFRNIKKMYRLKEDSKNTPQFVGNFINRYVYSELSSEILEELQKKNPPYENGGRQYRHHQWLTQQLGCPALEKQIVKINTLMAISDSKEQFDELFERDVARRKSLEEK